MHCSLVTAYAAKNVSFTWSENPSSEAIDGYKLYYRTGTSGPPYNGTGASEGSSPVAIGNVTSFTLHGLSETETYYFVLTAYRGDQESAYTNELVFTAQTMNASVEDRKFPWDLFLPVILSN